jgi:hypothetical protein
MHPWALAAPIQPNYPTIYNYINKPQKTKLSVEAQILTLNMGSNERKTKWSEIGMAFLLKIW